MTGSTIGWQSDLHGAAILDSLHNCRQGLALACCSEKRSRIEPCIINTALQNNKVLICYRVRVLCTMSAMVHADEMHCRGQGLPSAGGGFLMAAVWAAGSCNTSPQGHY